MGLPDKVFDLHAKWAHGPRNLITDVSGVLVGHVTLDERIPDETGKITEVHTGVTAILPHPGNLFQDKLLASATVINGFGKSMGLVQIEELGTIETPIIMTNTLSTGVAHTALTRYMLDQNPEIGVTTGTVNAVITECNDGRLNDIRGMHVTEEHVLEALEKAGTEFAEGAVGSGTGMVCLGLKGGIGSASRIVDLSDCETNEHGAGAQSKKTYTIGALVMSNFGEPGNLVIGGIHYDTSKISFDEKKDKGSIIIILATDLPLNERQLKRMAKRAVIGLARTGSYCGNGSGDIAIAFTTANHVPHESGNAVLETKMLQDDYIDCVFEATAEAVEEAVISSLYHAKTMQGVRGNRYMGLREFLEI